MFELTANVKQTSITYKSWIRMENSIVVNEYAPQTEFHLAAHEYSATPASQEAPYQSFSFVVLDFFFAVSVLHLVALLDECKQLNCF
jgi:hypothetical protein